MKVDFIIDGFNLYHTLSHNKPTRWLDLKAFCTSYLRNIAKDAELGDIYFFSASPTHMATDTAEGVDNKVDKHTKYINVLKNTGVIVQLGKFKKKKVKHYRPQEIYLELHKYEEKETDVAIGVKLFELMHNNTADAVALITGDTDICSAVKATKNNFPDKQIINILPFRSISKQLADMCDIVIKIKEKRYLDNQLPAKVKLKDGSVIEKPVNW